MHSHRNRLRFTLERIAKNYTSFYSSEPFTCHELGISLTLNESVVHRLLLCNKTSTFNLYSGLCSNFVFIYCLCLSWSFSWFFFWKILSLPNKKPFRIYSGLNYVLFIRNAHFCRAFFNTNDGIHSFPLKLSFFLNHLNSLPYYPNFR